MYTAKFYYFSYEQYEHVVKAGDRPHDLAQIGLAIALFQGLS